MLFNKITVSDVMKAYYEKRLDFDEAMELLKSMEAGRIVKRLEKKIMVKE